MSGPRSLASSRVGESPCHAAVGGVGEVGVAVDDDARIPPQLKNDFFLSRVVLDRPADGRAAGKTDEPDAFIGDQQSRVFVREQHRVESAIGPSRLLDHFGQQQCGERRLRRGLQNNGAAGGNGRRDFMHNQVQRKIERGDSGDRAERKTLDDAPAPDGRLLPIKRQIFAVAADRFFGRDIESKHRAVHFHARALNRLAGFECDGTGKLFFAIVDPHRNLAQNALALEGRQAACGPKGLHRGGNGRFGVFAASLINVGNQGAVVRSPPLPIDKKTMGCNRSHRHLGHRSPPSTDLV